MAGLFFEIMRDFAALFYKSKAWQHCRDAYARSKRGLCERCLMQGRYNAGVIVHHKIHLTPDNINDPNITLNPDNLMLLCRDCHALAHKPTKRFKVDEFGRITARG